MALWCACSEPCSASLATIGRPRSVHAHQTTPPPRFDDAAPHVCVCVSLRARCSVQMFCSFAFVEDPHCFRPRCTRARACQTNLRTADACSAAQRHIGHNFDIVLALEPSTDAEKLRAWWGLWTLGPEHDGHYMGPAAWTVRCWHTYRRLSVVSDATQMLWQQMCGGWLKCGIQTV